MKSIKRASALAMSVILAAGLSSCESDPVSQPAELIDDILEDTVWDDLDDLSDDDKLEGKTLKWLAHFDPWSRSTPSGEQCSEETKGAELFEEMYGGEIEWYPTAWDCRFNALEMYTIGGQGIDLFTGIRAAPKCIADQSVQSYDKYVDWDSPLWSSVKDLNDPFAVNGKHYLINCQEQVDSAVFYNPDVIRENGFDDPWELYKNGRWTMGKFMEMMEEYTDGNDEKYGLGSFYNSSAHTRLYLSGGVSPISLENGRLVNNISTPAFERAMDLQFKLYNRGLVLDDNTAVGYIGTAKNDALKNGDVLFYIAPVDLPGYDSPVNLGELGLAPMPYDEYADRYYHPMDVYGYYLCKGAENPKGAIKLMECVITSRNDENIQAEIRDFYKTECNFTDELLERKYEILRLARANPAFDILPGLPDDICSILDDLIYQQTEAEQWYSARESVSGTLDILINETNAGLEAISG